MAVAYDAVGPSGGGGTYVTNATTSSWSHTCTGSNRLLVVGLTVLLANTSDTMTVTYAGTAMALLTQIAPLADGVTYDRIYYLVAPATGANNVVITVSAAATGLTAGSVSFTGVSPTASLGTPQSVIVANDLTSTITLTGTQASSRCVDLWGFGGGLTPTGNKTVRWWNNTANGGWGQGCATQQTAPGGGSVAMTHTAGSGSGADWIGHIAAEILAVTATLPAPVNLHSTAITATTDALAWNAVTGASGYELVVSAVAGPSYNSDGVAVTALTVTPDTAATGATMTVTYTIQTNQAVTFSNLCAAVRDSANIDNSTLDFPWETGLTVNTTTHTNTTTRSWDHADTFHTHIAYQIGTSAWVHITTPTVNTVITGGSSGSWLSGASCVGASDGSFGTWRGTPVAIAGTWANQGLNATQLYQLDSGSEFGSWQLPLEIAISPFDSGGSWSAAASGSYDSNWNQSLTKLQAWVSSHPGPTYVRFAWENTGDWYPWAVNSGNYSDFITGWRRFSGMQKSTCPTAKLVFNVNRDSHGGFDWRQSFPGSQYVDVMSVDYYNQYPYCGTTGDWDGAVNSTDSYGAPIGLQQHLNFAASVGLPLCVSEWGGNADDGDSPTYVQEMHDFFAANAGTGAGKILYEILFNSSDSPGQWQMYPTTRMPNEAARYQ